jgi:glutamate/aspartate transport system substrate-binding protein
MTHTLLHRLIGPLCGILLLAPAMAQDLKGTLKKIKDSGEIVIGHRETSVPFSYFDEKQQAAGFSVELCQRIAEETRKALGMRELKVKYTAVSGQTRIPLLTNGTIDIECGGTTNNFSRQQQVDFGPTIFVTGTRLLVRKASGIKEIEDIGGKRVALVQGTTNEEQLKRLVGELKLANVSFVQAKDHSEAMLLVETSRADVYFTEDVLLYTMRQKSRRKDDFIVTGRYLTFDPYAFMVRRDDSAFRLVVGKAMADMQKAGDIARIYAKWFEPLGIPMGEDTRDAYRLQSFPN